MKITMLEQIINAMNALGGHCYYKDLYQQILTMYPYSSNSYASRDGWQCAVRTQIMRNSSDSQAYKDGKADIFYLVDFKGNGHWGLRNPIITEDSVDITNDDEGFVEGKEILKKHVLRERNHSLKVSAVKQFKNMHKGRVYCEICGFDFSEKYGDLGRDFIEIHHTKPVSEMKNGERTRIEDTVLLCSNCHSMIHRKRPWLSKERIKELIK